MTTSHRAKILMALTAAVALAATGCATKKYVNTRLDESSTQVESRVGERIDDVASQVEANQARLDQHEATLDSLSQTARDALDRALAAGKLAEGKLLYETVLSDGDVHFGSDQKKLSAEAQQALDSFATKLTSENRNVYIEIQGHTDATGSEAYNMRLGEERAEAVRRYLSSRYSIPLHRMSVISYGESAPLVANDSRDDRARNRRVNLVVLM